MKMNFNLDAIKEIIVGPQLHQEKNMKSLSYYLEQNNMSSEIIKKSDIPYTGW